VWLQAWCVDLSEGALLRIANNRCSPKPRLQTCLPMRPEMPVHGRLKWYGKFLFDLILRLDWIDGCFRRFDSTCQRSTCILSQCLGSATSANGASELEA
jgi:hypothetical protein